MNNLNFRAWHKEEKRMREVLVINFMNKAHVCVKNESIQRQVIWLNFNEVILMQSTGLKDSKGVEIFLDDLVEFQGEIYRVELDEDYAQPYLSRPYNDYSFGDNHEGCTVVGNLYEQPELLGGGE